MRIDISIAGQTVTDAERYFHLLNGLPSEWENYKDIITSTIPDIENWKNIIPKLETKESKLKYKKGVSADAALYTTRPNQRWTKVSTHQI
jgi:hypothetical protein